MDQQDLIKIEREQDKKYSQLISAVKGNDIKALKEYLPTAKDFIEFNQNRRTRDFHALETMVRYSSPEFINEVFDTYFSGNNEETLELKDKFLQERTNTGEKLNYKYFAHYLPQELTDKVADCYGIEKPAKYADEQNNVKEEKKEEKKEENNPPKEEPKSFFEKIKARFRKEKPTEEVVIAPKDTRPRMEQIYDIIKRENRSLNEYRNENVARRHLQLREEDEKPVEHFYTSQDKSKALRIEREAIPSIFVRKVDGMDDKDDRYKKDELVRIDLTDNLDGTKKDLVKSLYQNADFPDDYMWAVSALKQFEKEYAEIVESDSINLAQIKEFAKDGGRFFIETQKSSQGNSIGEGTIASAGKREGFSYIAFYADVYKEDDNTSENSLLHELIHRADHNSLEAFSNTEFFKQAAVLMAAEKDDGMVAKKASHIASNYAPGSIYGELLAYMNEEGEYRVGYSQLATLVRDIYGIYTEAKVHNDTETMEKIASYSPNWIEPIVSKAFELSNGATILDKEKMKESIENAIEDINEMKKDLGDMPSKDGMAFSPMIRLSSSIYLDYVHFKEEQKGVKNREQGLENMDKWIDNISKANNEKDFLKAVVMAYCYVKSYDKSGEDIFDESALPNLSVNQKDAWTKIFKDKATHIKALDIIKTCTKDEACLANEINMPISELITLKESGRSKIMLKKDDKEMKECLESMIDDAMESRKNEDFLKLLGGVEFFASRKGIASAFNETKINTQFRLQLVPCFTGEFIQKHFPEKEDVQTQTHSNVQAKTPSNAIKLRQDSSNGLQ